ncbi:hypothetical protein OROHE_002279 [Orobanche hederae]
MEFLNYSGLLLLLLLSVLIIFLALDCSTAKCCEDWVVRKSRLNHHHLYKDCYRNNRRNVARNMEWPRGSKTGIDDVFSQSDARFLEGRKMLQMMDKTKSSYLSETKSNGKPRKSVKKGAIFLLTGERRPAAVPQNTLYPQTTPKSHGDKNVVAKNVNRATKKSDESDALLEAADEVASLMRKDYRDYRRTPPINNHQPNN